MKVTKDRWLAAQAWELRVWNDENRPTLAYKIRRLLGALGPGQFDGNDWNTWWHDQFAGYQFLPRRLQNAIELGCGPYTNIRLIARVCQIDHIVCSDPLAKHYVRYAGRWLSEAWRTGRVLIDDHAIETCPFATDYFDLTVLINVLDHVQDAGLCLSQAMRITRPGGFLIVGQDLTDDEDAAQPANQADVGHPIRLTHIDMDQALLPRIAPQLHRVLPREQGRNPSAHYGTYLFAGRKLAGSS
jgi:SAM-dependent methyltransferase